MKSVAFWGNFHHIFNFSFFHESLSKGFRQNLCSRVDFILENDNSVIKTADWVAEFLLPYTSILGLIKMVWWQSH